MEVEPTRQKVILWPCSTDPIYENFVQLFFGDTLPQKPDLPYDQRNSLPVEVECGVRIFHTFSVPDVGPIELQMILSARPWPSYTDMGRHLQLFLDSDIVVVMMSQATRDAEDDMTEFTRFYDTTVATHSSSVLMVFLEFGDYRHQDQQGDMPRQPSEFFTKMKAQRPKFGLFPMLFLYVPVHFEFSDVEGFFRTISRTSLGQKLPRTLKVWVSQSHKLPDRSYCKLGWTEVRETIASIIVDDGGKFAPQIPVHVTQKVSAVDSVWTSEKDNMAKWKIPELKFLYNHRLTIPASLSLRNG
eukprot:TRINITY_DN4942_c1_g1_i3.p1 TRINITY_DN4942_c1_g1~~TRINITY_DN4942_c1_g1_i3.p1  ORF type:complete len:300 (+),score=35.32 TRINITY_DN4942_c1_g1_i3:39-938(+)